MSSLRNGMHKLSKFGTYRASATRNYSALTGSEHPATIRSEKRDPQSPERKGLDARLRDPNSHLLLGHERSRDTKVSHYIGNGPKLNASMNNVD